MPRYRLRAAPRRDDWSVIFPPVHDTWIDAEDRDEAVAKAKAYQINTWDTPTDVAWLVDEDGTIVWVMTRKD